MSENDRVLTRSMSRQNSVTVDTITSRINRVSTDDTAPSSPPRKHRLSTSETPTHKKKPRAQSKSKQAVKDFTKSVFGTLLIHTTPEASVTRSPKRRQRRKKAARSSKSPIACTFSEAGVVNKIVGTPTSSASEATGSTGSISLEFPTEIEADGSPSSPKPDPPELDSLSNNKQRLVEETADGLRNIGDKLDAQVRAEIIKIGVGIVKDAAYKKYTETLEALVNQNHSQVADPSDRYRVALVWLLTDTVVSKARAATVSDSTLKDIVDSAASYISERFPSWFDT